MSKITYTDLYVNGGGSEFSVNKVFAFLYDRGLVDDEDYQRHLEISEKYSDIAKREKMLAELDEYNRIKEKYDLK